MSPRLSLPVGLLMLALLPMQPQPAQGCATAWGLNVRGVRPVAIVDESAVVLWDEAQKVQHFIRWARFDASTSDFGFLVPTPAQPELQELSENIFTKLEEWTAPKTVTLNDWHFEPMFCIVGCGMNAKLDSKLAGVRVLDRQTVGGQDVAVLEADDAEDLRQWLDKHGYAARPELTAWLVPYVAAKWKITAFKIAQPSPGNPGVQTTPVRMSFRTERPFFPYREPADPKDSPQTQRGNRLLRVFFIGARRMQGFVGDTEWSARVPWSNAVDEARQSELAAALGLPRETLPTGARLTVFDDPSSSRSGADDVWFRPAANQESIVPPDRVQHYRIWVPGDLVVLGVAAIGLLALALRRARNRTKSVSG